MKLLYDSRKKEYKTPFGALRRKENCSITVRIPRRWAALKVSLLLEPDGAIVQPMKMTWTGLDEEGYDRYRISFSLPECGLYFYWFEVKASDCCYCVYRQNADETGIDEGEKWQLTCFSEHYQPPEGFAGTIMYQIFPDRFYHEKLCDTADKLTPFSIHTNLSEPTCYLPDKNGIVQNNDFYGGNLDGICKKLDYLKELGVHVLYLNPIFMAYSNHRYDTADYRRIDPLLGTEADFQNLCAKAHQMGMRVILDGVFSHTGSNSVYFDKENVFGTGAYHQADSPFREWYDFQSYPEAYTSWWGIDTLPCVTEEHPSYLDFIIRSKDSVIAHWLNCGADGFRLDVADELPDSFIRALTDRVKQIKPDAIVIGEVWEDASNKISYGKRRAYFTDAGGPELDAVMNYPFRHAILDLVTGNSNPTDFRNRILSIVENYPQPVLPLLMNSLSTHDTPRILSLFGKTPGTKAEKAQFRMHQEEFTSAFQKLKFAVFLQFFLPGIPCIYYGDEIGMEGFEDPFNRRYFTWNEQKQEVVQFYREIIRLHRLLSPEAEICFSDHKDCVMFQRGSLIAVCNPSEAPCTISVQYQKAIYLQAAETDGSSLQLKAYGFALLK